MCRTLSLHMNNFFLVGMGVGGGGGRGCHGNARSQLYRVPGKYKDVLRLQDYKLWCCFSGGPLALSAAYPQ